MFRCISESQFERARVRVPSSSRSFLRCFTISFYFVHDLEALVMFGGTSWMLYGMLCGILRGRWKVTGSPTSRAVAPSSEFLKGPLPRWALSFFFFFLIQSFSVCSIGKEYPLYSCLRLSGNCEPCVARACARVGRSEIPSEGTTPKGIMAVYANRAGLQGNNYGR